MLQSKIMKNKWKELCIEWWNICLFIMKVYSNLSKAEDRFWMIQNINLTMVKAYNKRNKNSNSFSKKQLENLLKQKNDLITNYIKLSEKLNVPLKWNEMITFIKSKV